ncbi:hypothetical protein KCP78_18835 [Salmonella enterica subsp. enterica]|nr:hypothetical protein KCP78_18835 [Salmonella enterica subsp. enterica]
MRNVPDTTKRAVPESAWGVQPAAKLCSSAPASEVVHPTGKLRRCRILLCGGCSPRLSSIRLPFSASFGSRNHGRERHFRIQRFRAENRRTSSVRIANDLCFYVGARASKPRIKGNSAGRIASQHCRCPRHSVQQSIVILLIKVISGCLETTKLSE